MGENSSKQRGLGRGLSALMADVSDTARDSGTTARRPDQVLAIETIVPNPEQPRRQFDEAALDDLAASIREKGIIQPLIVRAKGDQYEIVAGERRWRAAQIAQLHEIPVVIRDFNDTEVLEIAIIENIQRADLNPLEEAAGYKQLMEKFGHTQEKLSEVLGKSRSHIANAVRLLQLPDELSGYLREGKLSAGHARALITAEDPVALAKKVLKNDLSVRATEKLARTSAGQRSERQKAAAQPRPQKDADTAALEADLASNLAMQVTIDHAPDAENGKLTIHYNDLEQLDTLCRLLSGTD